MDIVFTIDEKFTRFCAVAIASLLKHNKTEEICFHIVTDNLTEKSKTILSELAKQSGACTYFYHVPKEKTEGYQVKAMSHRISLATFIAACCLHCSPRNYPKQSTLTATY